LVITFFFKKFKFIDLSCINLHFFFFYENFIVHFGKKTVLKKGFASKKITKICKKLTFLGIFLGVFFEIFRVYPLTPKFRGILWWNFEGCNRKIQVFFLILKNWKSCQKKMWHFTPQKPPKFDQKSLSKNFFFFLKIFAFFKNAVLKRVQTPYFFQKN
jgi:hypothetical protein